MPKALVEWEGSLLVERAVRTARRVCDPVLVVLGAQAVDVWRQADLGGATVLANADWETGMASSLRTGLDGLRGWPGRVDAALLLLVDMPGMTAEALQKVAQHASPHVLAVATYDGVRAHPVLIGREHWTGVAETATGDEGARRYLATHDVTEVDCTGLADPTDLDVPPPEVPSAP
jgi:molybdenum cofactor cytidylyltransferase/nicotine blue oxidoreductase